MRITDYKKETQNLNGRVFTGKELRDMFLGKTWKDLNIEGKITLASFLEYENFDDEIIDLDFPKIGLTIYGEIVEECKDGSMDIQPDSRAVVRSFLGYYDTEHGRVDDDPDVIESIENMEFVVKTNRLPYWNA